MKEKTRSGAGTFLMELLLGLLIFAITAAVCVRIFAASAVSARHSAEYTCAVAIAQNAAELCRGGIPLATLPLEWNAESKPDKNGDFKISISSKENEDGLADVSVTVENMQREELYTLDFSCEKPQETVDYKTLGAREYAETTESEETGT